MGEVRLSWSGEGLSFDTRASYGAPLTLGDEGQRDAAKAAERAVEIAETKYRAIAATIGDVVEPTRSVGIEPASR